MLAAVGGHFAILQEYCVVLISTSDISLALPCLCARQKVWHKTSYAVFASPMIPIQLVFPP